MKLFSIITLAFICYSCSSSNEEALVLQKIFDKNEIYLITQINNRIKTLEFRHQQNPSKTIFFLEKGTKVFEVLNHFKLTTDTLYQADAIIIQYESSFDSINKIVGNASAFKNLKPLNKNEYQDFENLKLMKSFLFQEIAIHAEEALTLMSQFTDAPYCYFGGTDITIEEKMKNENGYNFSINSEIFKHISARERYIKINSITLNGTHTDVDIELKPNYVISEIKMNDLQSGNYTLNGEVNIIRSSDFVYTVPFTHSFVIEK